VKATTSPTSTSRPRSLATLTLLTAAAFAGGALYGSRSAEATSHDQNPYAMVGQFGRVLVQIENNYVDPVDRTKLAEGAIRGMLEALDPHSAYMSEEEFALFESDTEGHFGGVGIEVESRGDQLVVIAPIEGSPAERAGIRSGDRVIAVDGEDVSRTTLDKLVHKMRGLSGSHVRISVRRPSDKDLLSFDLVRQVIHVPSVASRTLEGGVGYIRVKQFQEKTHDELLRTATKLRAEGKGNLRGLVLDLRNNPGGLVDESAEVADEFLEAGTIYTERHRGQIVDEVTAKSGGAFADLPMVVLVNEYSASAAELLAAALQDQKRALVVGANTFGKGSVQTIIDLPGGAGIRLTTARYYTPSGRSVQAEGIHPDVLVELNRDPATVALPTLHERDLEGHLSPERGAAATGLPRPVYREPPEPAERQNAGTAPARLEASYTGGASPGAEGTDARNVPKDPSTGTDFALRIAYQTLLGKLGGARATP
jgi:carboxyl-terminal processing protease